MGGCVEWAGVLSGWVLSGRVSYTKTYSVNRWVFAKWINRGWIVGR